MVARFVGAITFLTTAPLALGVPTRVGGGQTLSPAAIGARVEQVRVDVRVTDSRENPVMNLHASDFEVMDDGRRQRIASFTVVTETTPPGPTRGPSTDTTQNTPGGPGRVVVVVLDDLHIAAANTPRVKDSVRSFLETVVSPADSVAIVFTSGANRGGQEFTADRRLVHTAVDTFRGQKLRSATVERLQDPRLNLGGIVDPNADPNQPERANRSRISLEALRRIGETLVAFEDRRPMVLLVSEGPEYEVAEDRSATRSDQWSINGDIRRAVQALNRVNAVVFAVDPRGVSSGNADQIHASSVFETAGAGTLAIQRENMRAFGVVHNVATNTGGFTMLWRPNMARDFRRVITADGSYYIVSYDAPSTNRGQYHQIVIRVQKKGLQVNARSGYFLPTLPTPP